MSSSECFIMRWVSAAVCLLALADVALSAETITCPPDEGGLLTDGEPSNPGPFHGVTIEEYQRVYDFLAQQPDINLGPAGTLDMKQAMIGTADLLLPPKVDVLDFLDNGGAQPPREALVMIMRGDKEPPVVEEYRVGPLDNPTYAELIVNSQRKNPVPFTVRFLTNREESHLTDSILGRLVDATVGDILMESYGARYENCGDNCLHLNRAPMGTAFWGDINIRRYWIVALMATEFPILYPVDFSVLADMSSTDHNEWTVEKVWYAGTYFDSLEELKDRYYNDPTLPKTKVDFIPTNRSLKSTLNLRGDPVPTPPKRPPVQIEPDGKRYNIEYSHVSYLGWELDFRLSSLTGPQVYDVRFQGDRIAYQLGLSEIAVFYTGWGPMQQVMNYVDSGGLLGVHSRALVPGADCPEGATFVDLPFMMENSDKPSLNARAMCIFEQNTGDPLRRHLTYYYSDGFYGGMADSVLVVRSAMTIYNYDYVIDFKFHQSGAVEVKAMSTGYIMASFYHPGEDPYGFLLDENISGNLHHHMFHFKVDLDIAGTSNRYENIAFSAEDVDLTYISESTKYHQLRFDRSLPQTEEEAVYHFDFEKPGYHIVYNEQNKTDYGVPRAYRISMNSPSKQLLRPDHNHEATIPWARQQMAVTVQKDEELSSSSPYGMFDSQDPTVDFSNFISDESIVDQDLVFWVTMGVHHLPHTEDLPVTPTAGGHLSFFLLPYNYFPECPSMASRDAIRLEHEDSEDVSSQIVVEKNGNKDKGLCDNPSLQELVEDNPDHFLESE